MAVSPAIIPAGQGLAHRLGLIPIAVDPDKCKWPDDAETETPLKFKLHVKCKNGERSRARKPGTQMN